MIRLRFARPEDTETLLALYAPFVRDGAVTFENQVPALAAYRDRIAQIQSFYPYLVCEQEGRILGYAYAHALREREAYQWSAELSIYLHPAAQGQGVGTILYSALMELLREQGICTVYGCVTLPNPASEALHRSLGFTLSGVWKKSGFKAGSWWDVGWFEKSLGPYPDDPVPPRPVSTLPPEHVQAILTKYPGKE